jgi:hypothetical protein
MLKPGSLLRSGDSWGGKTRRRDDRMDVVVLELMTFGWSQSYCSTKINSKSQTPGWPPKYDLPSPTLGLRDVNLHPISTFLSSIAV